MEDSTDDWLKLSDTKKRVVRTENVFQDLGTVANIGYAIIIPIVIGGLVGRYSGHTTAGIAIGSALALAGFIKKILELIGR